MRSQQGNTTLPANVLRLIISVPIVALHNITITSNSNGVFLGGNTVVTSAGIPMNQNDVINFSWQDFQKSETGSLDIYGIATADSTVAFQLWRRD